MLRAAVAAGHPATTQAGVEILEAGGSAADAAVAACLASCVAETVMTGLLGGGHAIYWDAATRTPRNLDCFCDVPSGHRTALLELDVQFGEELVHYAVGPASCAVPGVPAGLDLLWREYGRLPWQDVCAPALRLAKEGVTMPPAHVACLQMLEPVMTMREGARIYAPTGRLLVPGERLEQPGLVTALEIISTEGTRSVYSGTIAEALIGLMHERDGPVTPTDLGRYEARWTHPLQCSHMYWRVLTRRGISGVPNAFVNLGGMRIRNETDRVLALVHALARFGPTRDGHTTNLVVVDGEGNACVFTTSLGLGSGDWLPGLDLHLNSMLGEVDLLVDDLVPGERMESMMAPTLEFSYKDDELALAIGAAGGTRLRTALVTVAALALDVGMSPQDAVEAPRIHPAGDVLHAEPGVDEPALEILESRGWRVRRWPERHHYFGGVSLISRNGAAADSRRSGAAEYVKKV